MVVRSFFLLFRAVFFSSAIAGAPRAWSRTSLCRAHDLNGAGAAGRERQEKASKQSLDGRARLHRSMFFSALHPSPFPSTLPSGRLSALMTASYMSRRARSWGWTVERRRETGRTRGRCFSIFPLFLEVFGEKTIESVFPSLLSTRFSELCSFFHLSCPS